MCLHRFWGVQPPREVCPSLDQALLVWCGLQADHVCCLLDPQPALQHTRLPVQRHCAEGAAHRSAQLTEAVRCRGAGAPDGADLLHLSFSEQHACGRHHDSDPAFLVSEGWTRTRPHLHPAILCFDLGWHCHVDWHIHKSCGCWQASRALSQHESNWHLRPDALWLASHAAGHDLYHAVRAEAAAWQKQEAYFSVRFATSGGTAKQVHVQDCCSRRCVSRF